MLDINKVNFTKMNNGLIPAIIQDNNTLQVLMLGFMNKDALNITMDSKRVTFFSRSKNRIWQKGETSGNFLDVIDMQLDCDNDSLLIMVNPVGATCHTGSNTCFNQQSIPPLSCIGLLNQTILNRVNYPKANSYTKKLMDSGLRKIAQKVGEEATEVVIAALNESSEAFLGELTDLWYHSMVLLHSKNLDLKDVATIIKQRFNKSDA